MIKFFNKHQKSASLLWKPPQLLWIQKNLRIGHNQNVSKNVYKAEIDKVEKKLWRFTLSLGTLILGHPVVALYNNFTMYLVSPIGLPAY